MQSLTLAAVTGLMGVITLAPELVLGAEESTSTPATPRTYIWQRLHGKSWRQSARLAAVDVRV